MEDCVSRSRQALILRRRQTQQSSSVEKGATSAPQTTQAAFLAARARGADLRAAGAGLGAAGSAGVVFLRGIVPFS